MCICLYILRAWHFYHIAPSLMTSILCDIGRYIKMYYKSVSPRRAFIINIIHYVTWSGYKYLSFFFRHVTSLTAKLGQASQRSSRALHKQSRTPPHSSLWSATSSRINSRISNRRNNTWISSSGSWSFWEGRKCSAAWVRMNLFWIATIVWSC